MSEQNEFNQLKQDYINNLKENLRYSVTKFDTQTLTISGAALAFCLTFIKDIVPFSEAIYIPLFYISLLCFLVTVFLGLFGHYLSMKEMNKAIILADNDQFDKIANKEDVIPKINALVITSLISGIFLLIVYSVINIENSRKKLPTKIGLTLTDDNVVINTKKIKSIIYKDSLETKQIKIEKWQKK